MKTKKCKYCNEVKEVINFSKHSSTRDRLDTKCKECRRKYSKRYRQDNKEYIAEWRTKNREYYLEYNKKYFNDNREYIYNYLNSYREKKYKEDPLYNFKHRLRANISRAFLQGTKSNRSEQILGCTFEEAKKHIEEQFKEGMSWDNRDEWHIDHTVPLSLAKTEEQAMKLSHYTNLQPMWAKENLVKSNKLTEEGKKVLKELELELQ